MIERRAGLMAVVVCCSATIVEADFIITNLGTLPGGTTSSAQDINNAGQVAGYSGSSNGERAVRYDGSSWIDLGTLPGGNNSRGFSINDAGNVVGISSSSSGSPAALFTGTTVVNLGVLPGGTSAAARAINASGLIVGDSTSSAGFRAFVHDGTTMQNLGTLPGSAQSFGWDINGAGHVVGESGTIGVLTKAFLHDGTTMHNLGTIGGVNGTSAARGINDSGLVVGFSDTTAAGGERHAFLYDGVSMMDLGTLGGAQSFAHGINDLDQIVGTADTVTGQRHAFLYENGAMLDLNDLVTNGEDWILTWAFDINDSGQIVGEGLFQGQTRAFLLTPQAVPEPGSLALLAITGLGFASCRLGKRRGRRTNE